MQTCHHSTLAATGFAGLVLTGSLVAQEVAVAPPSFFVDRAPAGQMVCIVPVEWPALQRYDPAYPAAQELSTALIARGFFIQCIAPSKMASMFDGQQGAALFRTKQGTFEVLFLPKDRTFDALQIDERRDGRRYRYSFAGDPKPWPANLIDSSRPVYFIKDGPRLLVSYDEKTAAELNAALLQR